MIFICIHTRPHVASFLSLYFYAYYSIRLNDISEIGAAFLDFPRTPLLAVIVLLSTLNRRRVLTT